MGLKNTWFNRTFRGQALDADKRIGEASTQARSDIDNLIRYEIPEEAKQNMSMLQDSADVIRGTTGLATEATDIARAATGTAEAPGEALARKDIQQGTAGTVQDIMQYGGGGANTLAAIAKAGQNEQSAFGQLAMNRTQYKSQAEQNLANSLRSEAGFTANAEAQAAGLESAGLQEMSRQKGIQYEFDLNRELTGLDFDLNQLGSMRNEEQERRNRNSKLWGSAIGAVSGIAGTMMGNPMALGNVASNLGIGGGGGGNTGGSGGGYAPTSIIPGQGYGGGGGGGGYTPTSIIPGQGY